GDDRDLRAVRAEGVADGIGGVVRNREWIDLDVADFESLASADVFDALDCGLLARLFGVLCVHFHDFAVRRLGEVRGAIPFARQLGEAGRMIGVLVGDENRVHALGTRAAESVEPAEDLLAAKASVNEECRALGFEQRRVARSAGGENRYAERDAKCLRDEMMAKRSGRVKGKRKPRRHRGTERRRQGGTERAELRQRNNRRRAAGLVDGVGVDAYVRFAGGFLFVVLLHPGGEALSGGGVASGEDKRGDVAVGHGEFAGLTRLLFFGHQANQAIREPRAAHLAVEDVAFDRAAVFERESHVATIVERLFERGADFRLGGRRGNPAFEILVDDAEALFRGGLRGRDVSVGHLAIGRCYALGVMICTSWPEDFSGALGAPPIASGSLYLLNSVARTVARKPPTELNVSLTALAS